MPTLWMGTFNNHILLSPTAAKQNVKSLHLPGTLRLSRRNAVGVDHSPLQQGESHSGTSTPLVVVLVVAVVGVVALVAVLALCAGGSANTYEPQLQSGRVVPLKEWVGVYVVWLHVHCWTDAILWDGVQWKCCVKINMLVQQQSQQLGRNIYDCAFPECCAVELFMEYIFFYQKFIIVIHSAAQKSANFSSMNDIQTGL